jgi:hypothetical protein
MPDVISDYRKWKVQGENLKSQAKQAMESRFRELLTEAVAIAEEYGADFGAPLKPPPSVTAFRYKAHGKAKSKKTGRPPATKTPESARPEPKEHKPDPKIAGHQKRLATAKKKLDDAKAAGTPARALEDGVYEVEAAIRFAGQPA